VFIKAYPSFRLEMLSDRSYMRDSYPRTTRSALVWIISATVGGFILANVFERLFLSGHFTDLFALSTGDIQRGYFWQFFTYGFVQKPEELFGVLTFCFNLMWLYLFGRELEGLLGAKRLTWLYLTGLALGGVAWFGLNYKVGGQISGAWPGVAALFVMYACLNANQRIPLLIFFVFPVTLKPKYLAWAAVVFEVCALFFIEFPHHESRLGSPAAHLAGMFVGFLYFRFVHEREWRTPDGVAEIELPQWLKKKQKSPETAPPVYKVNLDREALRAEVDRILDKINSDGFAALTSDEKRLLDDAKDLLSRR